MQRVRYRQLLFAAMKGKFVDKSDAYLNDLVEKFEQSAASGFFFVFTALC